MNDLDCCVGETVKLRKRTSVKENYMTTKRILLLEEEGKIARMKEKLNRRARREARRKKDKERMERGNLELRVEKENNKSSSFKYNKSVIFDEGKPEVRNISPIGDEDTIIAVESQQIYDPTPHQRQKATVESQEVYDPTPHQRQKMRVESQDTYEPTPQQDSKIGKKQEKRKQLNEGQICLSPKHLPGSKLFAVTDFSLPKEYTSLKLEKLREDKILSPICQNLDKKGSRGSIKRLMRDSKSSNISPSKRLDREVNINEKGDNGSENPSNNDTDNLGDVLQFLVEKSLDTNLTIVCCVSSRRLQVYLRYEVSSNWLKVGEFIITEPPIDPFLVIDGDIQVKTFRRDDNSLKETSYVIQCDEVGSFTNPITSKRNVLVLTESKAIKNIIWAKVDNNQVALFHNMDCLSRGSLVMYDKSDILVKYISTVDGETLNIQKVKGTTNIFASFLKNCFYFWDYLHGICLRKHSLHISMNPENIFKLHYSGHLLFFELCEKRSEIKISIWDEESSPKEVTKFCLPHKSATSSASLTTRVSLEKFYLMVGPEVVEYEIKSGKVNTVILIDYPNRLNYLSDTFL